MYDYHSRQERTTEITEYGKTRQLKAISIIILSF